MADTIKFYGCHNRQLKTSYQTFGAGVNAVLDGYVGSLSNALALEAPVKKTTQRSSKTKESKNES